ncbi:MAG: TetR/AcrR family transcriptional regulator [Actinobacteria bacterium]|nr:MAG: TetR/AcrR family transcriptional regulator [Actinomycetota bacterium]
MSKRRGPRSSGAPDARSQILESARRSFAESGYDRTTIRGVARDADVDPSLVIHYFGSKENLFAESVELPMSPELFIGRIFDGDPGGAAMAERLVRVFFEVWERPASRRPLLGQLRVAFSTGQPPPMGEFVFDLIVSRVAEHVTGPQAELRIEMAAAHLLGVAMLRYVGGREPLASVSVDELVAMVTPRIASYLESG